MCPAEGVGWLPSSRIRRRRQRACRDRSWVGHVRRSQITDAKITHGTAIFIFDFVVKQKLFNFFLLLGCVQLVAEHTLTETMAANNPWPKPVTVYGYDNTVSFAGSIYEAETKCTSTHNWGQVASDTASYMAFYSRLSAAVSGRSSVFNVNSLLTGLHLLLTYLSCHQLRAS